MALDPHERESAEKRVTAIDAILDAIQPGKLQEFGYWQKLLLEKEGLQQKLAERDAR